MAIMTGCGSVMGSKTIPAPLYASAQPVTPQPVCTPSPPPANTPAPAITPASAAANTPRPSAAPAPTAINTPMPSISAADLDKLDADISFLLGRYKIDEARALLQKVFHNDMADAGFETRMQKIDAYESYQTDLVLYTGVIEHMFTHCLIAFPDICYAGNAMTKSLDRDCVTPYEFKKIILSLYKNNYVLVDANLIADITDSGVKLHSALMIPKGKKP